MSGKHYFEVRYWANGVRLIEIHVTERAANRAAKWINDMRDERGCSENASRASVHDITSSHNMIEEFRKLKRDSLKGLTA